MATVSSKVPLLEHKKTWKSPGKTTLRIPGGLKHISVGSKSVFGVNCDDNIYTMTDISFDAKECFEIDASILTLAGSQEPI